MPVRSLLIHTCQEVEVYEKILLGLCNMESEIIIETYMLKTGIWKLYHHVMNDYIEFETFVDCDKTKISHMNIGVKVVYTIVPYYTVSNYGEAINSIMMLKQYGNMVIEGFEIRKDDSVEKRVNKIYRYITTNYKYETRLGNSKERKHPEVCYRIQCIYQKTAVCSGISKIFLYLSKLSNLTAAIVWDGYASGKNNDVYGGHAWNIVRYEDGSVYHFDATWDLGEKEYKYYKLDDIAIRCRYHRWERRYYPICLDCRSLK